MRKNILSRIFFPPVTFNNSPRYLMYYFSITPLSQKSILPQKHPRWHTCVNAQHLQKVFKECSKKKAQCLKSRYVYTALPFLSINRVVNVIAQEQGSAICISFPFLRVYHRVTHLCHSVNTRDHGHVLFPPHTSLVIWQALLSTWKAGLPWG